MFFICNCLLFFLILNFDISGSDSLRQLHIVFRHGERTPSSTYPNDPYKDVKWPEGYGLLTKRGKYEMYELGQQLLKNYEFFVPMYSPTDVEVKSSYADRCLMSAQLVSAGMFPPRQQQIWSDNLLWQPIPVHYLPRNVDNNIAMKSKCAKYDKEFLEMLDSPKVQNLLRDNSDLLQFLTEQTGRNISTVENVETIFNILVTEQTSGFALPEWASNTTLLKKMHQLAAINLALYSDTELMKRLKGGKLLSDILSSMKKNSDGQKEPSVVLWSGHDLTLVHLGRVLNVFDIAKPGFAANFIFELYSNKEIKIKYQDSLRDTSREEIIKGCNSPCYLEDFEKTFDMLLPKDWNEECKLDNN